MLPGNRNWNKTASVGNDKSKTKKYERRSGNADNATGKRKEKKRREKSSSSEKQKDYVIFHAH